MRRRGKAGGKTLKAQRPKTLTRRNVPESISSRSSREETNIARELHEAREQQVATAEILRVIRTSPNDVQPVFETIVRNAVSLCGGLFANVFRFDGELLHYVASHNVGPSYADMIRARYPMRPRLFSGIWKSRAHEISRLAGGRAHRPELRSTIPRSHGLAATVRGADAARR